MYKYSSGCVKRCSTSAQPYVGPHNVMGVVGDDVKIFGRVSEPDINYPALKPCRVKRHMHGADHLVEQDAPPCCLPSTGPLGPAHRSPAALFGSGPAALFGSGGGSGSGSGGVGVVDAAGGVLLPPLPLLLLLLLLLVLLVLLLLLLLAMHAVSRVQLVVKQNRDQKDFGQCCVQSTCDLMCRFRELWKADSLSIMVGMPAYLGTISKKIQTGEEVQGTQATA